MRPGRTLIALALSLVVHVAAGAGLVGVAVWKGWQLTAPIAIELTSVKVDDLKALPLGPPPPPPGAPEPAARRRARAKADRGEGVKLGSAADAGSDGGAGPPGDAGVADAAPDAQAGVDGGTGRTRDLRGYGPEGSRLTALLRLDRLRASPDGTAMTAAVDSLLRLLPDRRRLLEGSGIDLYRDFDALLIATPNPLDDAVTFLAARHRLSDDAFMRALDKGATVGGRPIDWQKHGDRFVGIRRGRARAGGEPAPLERDDRILVLPQPGLAVIAPPAYARLLLPPVPTDGGAGQGDPAATASRWRALVAQIDAEDGAMPDEAILMMTAANLLDRRGGAAAPRPGGTAPGLGAPAGLALPSVATLFVGLTPTPYLTLEADFGGVPEARAWEQQWTGFRAKLLGNPLVLLGGFMPIVSRSELRREEATIILRTTATAEETLRILGLVTNLLGARGQR